MKWSNFLHTLDVNSDLAGQIRMHVGSPMLASAPLNHSEAEALRMLRRYVEEKLTSVVFRGFPSLALSSGNNEWRRRETIDGGVGERKTSLHETYSVCFQIVGVEEIGHRLAFVDSRGDRLHVEVEGYTEEPTLLAVIDSRIAWHRKYWAGQGKQLRFNAVIRKTTLWENLHCGDRLVSEGLEVFRLPEDRFTF